MASDPIDGAQSALNAFRRGDMRPSALLRLVRDTRKPGASVSANQRRNTGPLT